MATASVFARLVCVMGFLCDARAHTNGLVGRLKRLEIVDHQTAEMEAFRWATNGHIDIFEAYDVDQGEETNIDTKSRPSRCNTLYGVENAKP